MKPASVSDLTASGKVEPLVDRCESMLLRVTKSLSDSFNTCVDKLVNSLEQKMTICMDVQSSEVFELNKRLDTLEKNYKDLLQEHSTLKSQFKLMADQIDNQRASSDELEQ